MSCSKDNLAHARFFLLLACWFVSGVVFGYFVLAAPKVTGDRMIKEMAMSNACVSGLRTASTLVVDDCEKNKLAVLQNMFPCFALKGD